MRGRCGSGGKDRSKSKLLLEDMRFTGEERDREIKRSSFCINGT